MQYRGWLSQKSPWLNLKSRDEHKDKVFCSSELRSIHRSELKKLNNILKQAVENTHVHSKFTLRAWSKNQGRLVTFFVFGE